MSCFNSQRDGILPTLIWCTVSPAAVSIPNGMEFYAFSTFSVCPFSWVSIPNGMEFYLEADGILISGNLFQFPTGWNSTRHLTGTPEISAKVSIPNGMEFYAALTTFWLSVFAVSIPNGMEFYKSKKSKKKRNLSFNSQRDGILRFRGFTMLLNELLFQFPTGWNSTRSRFRYWWAYCVSIPNGMEFYRNSRRG